LRTDDLANHLPRHAEFSANRLDRTTINKVGARILAIVSTTSIPTSASMTRWKPLWTPAAGLQLDADYAENGVLISRRNTNIRKQLASDG
jgi:hypothetical protein